MEEKAKAEEKTAQGEEIVEKKGFFGKLRHPFKKNDKTPAAESGEAEVKPKRTFRQKLSDNKGKIIAGAVGTAAVAVGLLKIAMHSAVPEGTVDPEIDPEPGDWLPEDVEAMNSGESSEVEVNAE